MYLLLGIVKTTPAASAKPTTKPVVAKPATTATIIKELEVKNKKLLQEIAENEKLIEKEKEKKENAKERIEDGKRRKQDDAFYNSVNSKMRAIFSH
jgi:sucrose-6-phosphate hydrolase SacC (GH32 family)